MKAKYLSTVSRAWKICAAIWVGAILLSLPIAIVLDVSGYDRWLIQDFPEVGGANYPRGTHTRFCQIYPKTA